MELILIVPESPELSASTRQIWQDVCLNQHIKLKILDLQNSDGQALARKLDLKSFPALILNNTIAAVGNPDKQTAEKIIADLITNQ